MEELVLSMVLQIVSHFVKNPASAAQFKSQLLSIRDAINALYPGA